MFNKEPVLMIQAVFLILVFLSSDRNRSQLLILGMDWLRSSPKHRGSTLYTFLSSSTPHGHSDQNLDSLTCLT